MKLQDSVFTIIKNTNLSPSVLGFLQTTDDFPDKATLGGVLRDTCLGWLAVGPRLCVVDLKTGQKVSAWTFGAALANYQMAITNVAELPTPLTENSHQLVISLECEVVGGMICVFHVNGSRILRCIQTQSVITEVSVFDKIPDGPLACFDGVVVAGTKNGEVIAFDMNRAGLVQALKDTSQGYENLICNELNMANLAFLSHDDISAIEEQRELALESDDNMAVLVNEHSYVDGQYIFRNPDDSVRMKAKRDHIRVSALLYVPQMGSIAVGYNFGAFQIWNLMDLSLTYTSQVNVECLPVTNFGFQEPCDDPRSFCYLWVVYSVIDRFEEEEFPLAVMYSLTYQGKRMLSDTKCLYQDFTSCTIRFQLELSCTEDAPQAVGGRCVACHTSSVNSTLGDGGEDSVLNICQLVWECWAENANMPGYCGMLLFDLDQWYKDQMPATWRLESNTFMSVTSCGEVARGMSAALDVRIQTSSLALYTHATRLEEHFYPNSLQYSCICLSTGDISQMTTTGVQRQIISGMDEVGPTVLLNPAKLYNQCVAAGLTPLYVDSYSSSPTPMEQRKFLLSTALEARLSRFLKRCAHDWATGSHSGAGCTLSLLVEWCWQRALALKRNARELTAPLFHHSAGLPDRNVCRCLEHCVRQLTQLASLLDAVLTKCCNLVVPDALSEIEEKYKGIGTVALYFQVVQWFLNVGLLPEHQEPHPQEGDRLPYPGQNLIKFYQKRRLKLQRLDGKSSPDNNAANSSCPLLYIDQLIEQECGGEMLHEMWRKGGSECGGVYPPPSLYSLLRLYLLPSIGEEHKHSLVLYLLVDYSMLYDELRYEAVIRRLMQFPTMFGLSNTAIKATQAFWHLDHRDFDFALDQLQCLTGNTLADWQHNVVLSALLAQKKTQAALQYLHVRKPAPVQNILRDGYRQSDERNFTTSRANDCIKLEDWQSCCELYLARELVFEALDVIRLCVQNARQEEKCAVLNFFFKVCRNTGQLSKVLQISLSTLEEETFIKYLKDCGDERSSDILVMYYLQQARYLEAQQFNNKLRQPNTRQDMGSLESMLEGYDRDSVRDALVDIACASLPLITSKIHGIAGALDGSTHVAIPKPMSVFVQAKSPKNTFTYKSSFIQNSIENASEIWIQKPKLSRGLKRALSIEDTPFICTPKLARMSRSIFNQDRSDMSVDGDEHSPPKRPRFNLSATSPRTPKNPPSAVKLSEKLNKEMQLLLEMPEVEDSPQWKLDSGPLERRSVREATPQSILKVRRVLERENNSSPVSQYLDTTDDEMETASNHTHFSDNTAKHLRFTIRSKSNSLSTPSPPSQEKDQPEVVEVEEPAVELPEPVLKPRDDRTTSPTRTMAQGHPSESPRKKLATEASTSKKPFKDNVRARRSLSISANSSLNDDPNASIESIADFPITLINPRFSGDSSFKRRSKSQTPEAEGPVSRMPADSATVEVDNVLVSVDSTSCSPPRTPKGRRSIRLGSASVAVDSTIARITRSRSQTPERLDSPIAPKICAPPSSGRKISRSRSKTPESKETVQKPVLAPIEELPKLESDTDHPQKATKMLSFRVHRSRSKTPERKVRSPRLEPISETPSIDTSSNEPLVGNKSRTPERNVNLTVPRLEVITESASAETSANKDLRHQLRTPPMTPEKVVKRDVVTPTKEALVVEEPSSSLALSSGNSSPLRRSQRSRSNTPETDIIIEPSSPRSLRSNSKTPERDNKLLRSPKLRSVEKSTRSRKPLSRLVLEANTFSQKKQRKDDVSEDTLKLAKAATVTPDISAEISVLEDSSDSILESTPMKLQNVESNALFEYNLSPIDDNSILNSSSSICVSSDTPDVSQEEYHINLVTPKSVYTPTTDTSTDKSILGGYQSSNGEESSDSCSSTKKDSRKESAKLGEVQMLTDDPLGDISTISTNSVLKDSSQSVVESDSDAEMKELESHPTQTNISFDISDRPSKRPPSFEDNLPNNVIQQEKRRIVEIEREISEIEEDIAEYDSESVSNDEDMTGEENVEEENDSGTEDSSEDESDDTTDPANNALCEDDSDSVVISIVDTSSDDEVNAVVANIVKNLDKQSTTSTDSNELKIDEDAISHISELSQPPVDNELDCLVVENDNNRIIEENASHTSELAECTKDNKISINITENKIIGKDIQFADSSLVEDKTIDSNMAVDVLNDANYSFMTDDNSVIETDQSEMHLSYTEEDESTIEKQLSPEKAPKMFFEVSTDEVDHKVDDSSSAQIEPAKEKPVIVNITENIVQQTVKVPENIEQKKGMTEEKSYKQNDEKLKEATHGMEIAVEQSLQSKPQAEEKPAQAIELPAESTARQTVKTQEMEVTSGQPIQQKFEAQGKNSQELKITAGQAIQQEAQAQEKIATQIETAAQKETLQEMQITAEKTAKRDITAEQTIQKKVKVQENPEKAMEIAIEESDGKKDEVQKKMVNITPEAVVPEAPIKSNILEMPAPSRKRTTSVNSGKSEEKSPSRRQTSRTSEAKDESLNITESQSDKKTPVRRRPSRSSETKDESLNKTVTPLRRSTRRRISDDSASVASDASNTKSTKSKANQSKADDTDSVISGSGSLRKSRRSVLPHIKPDLSVIPEIANEEVGSSNVEESSEIMNEYSSARRLTRHQKSVLEKWLDPKQTKVVPKPRRARVSSKADSEVSIADDNSSTTLQAFDVPPVDRISLMNKKDFEGSPDREELQNIELQSLDSSESYTSDVSKPRLRRASRTASDTGSIKGLRKSRRLSVDPEALQTPERGSPALDGSLLDSTGRPRRISFNKAIEALSTPKRGRRVSTDVKETDGDSVTGSPREEKDADVNVTPARRTRRASSTKSTETARRVRSTASVDETPVPRKEKKQ